MVNLDREYSIGSLKKIRNNNEESSSLIKRINNLIFYTKIKDFEAEDLRILIGQNEHLDICLPLALEFIEQDPMVEGDFYPGDLLNNVLKITADFWTRHVDLKDHFLSIINKNLAYIKDFDVSEEIKEDILSGVEYFLQNTNR